MSILMWQVAGAPVAVVDVETTGFVPGSDRIVEISIVHFDGESPRLVFDSLVHPGRGIPRNLPHGLSDLDVESAPPLRDLSREIASHLCGRVVVGHNVEFDLRFLARELGALGPVLDLPFVCTRQLGALLGLIPRTGLADACRLLRVEPPWAHVASQDALAAARLFSCFREEVERRGMRDFRELMTLGSVDCMGSWTKLPLVATWLPSLPGGAPPVSRATVPIEGGRAEDYATAVLECVADLQINELEADRLRRLCELQRLPPERVRAAHAAVFTWFLSAVAADSWVDEVERGRIASVASCLRLLGWAPGD